MPTCWKSNVTMAAVSRAALKLYIGDYKAFPKSQEEKEMPSVMLLNLSGAPNDNFRKMSVRKTI